MSNSEETSKRKQDHVEIALNKNVQFKNKSNGFEYYDFLHNAATEVNFDKIDLSLKFLNKRISYPFLISSMTGGFKEAGTINEQLAEAAETLNIPLGVGSQRQVIENTNFRQTFRIIREKAPSIPILSNIGEAEICGNLQIESIKMIIELIEADALIIHLNPLQELIQPEGKIKFKGLMGNISSLVKNLEVPVIVKEVGSGIDDKTAVRLLDAGVKGIDVAGAGGTSWAGVELLRKNNKDEELFWDWGIPTSYCIRKVKDLKKRYKFILIGSGGISNGMEAAKAIALGADLVASARPILLELDKNGIEGVKTRILNWMHTIKIVMFLTDSNNLKELRDNKLIGKNNLH